MPFDEIPPDEAHRRLLESPGAIYLDVRSVEEYDAGHPEGAWNLPVLHRGATGMEPNPEFRRVAEATLPRDAPLIVGCKVGGRSRRACELLQDAGFQNVANVLGGFGGATDPRTGAVIEPGWQARGLPSTAEPTPGRTWSELRREAG